MGCRASYVSELFNGGKSNPSSELLENLLSSLRAEGVNIRRAWLMQGTGDRYEAERAPALKEGHDEGNIVPYKTAADQTLEWLLGRFSDEEIQGFIHDATAAKNWIATEKLAELMKQIVSSRVDAVAAAALKQGVAAVKRPGVVYGRSPKAVSTSGKTSAPARSVAPEKAEPPKTGAPAPE